MTTVVLLSMKSVNKIKYLLITFLLIMTNAHAVEQKDFALVKKVVDAFKSNNKVNISKLVSYPLLREYPIPAIDNEEEFIARFNDVFDQRLLNLIINSDIDKDWSAVGWRGFMLGNGDLWLDHDGRVLAINYQSNIEKAIKERLIQEHRSNLHESIKDFVKPLLEMKTKRFRIRIDDMANGNLRYAAWPITNDTSEKPDLILVNGERIYDGSGGNHRYVFENGRFTYLCSVNVIGTVSTPEASLDVFDGDKRILSEDAVEVINR